jgi:hypothetical protein
MKHLESVKATVKTVVNLLHSHHSHEIPSEKTVETLLKFGESQIQFGLTRDLRKIEAKVLRLALKEAREDPNSALGLLDLLQEDN